MIDKHTLEIKQDEEKTVYKNLEEIGDDLPDHSPRFVLLSYPLTLVRQLLILENKVDADSFETIAFRTIIGAIRIAILSSSHLQCRVEDVVCWRKGADEKYGRGWKGHRD
jgi:hypothetical protein